MTIVAYLDHSDHQNYASPVYKKEKAISSQHQNYTAGTHGNYGGQANYGQLALSGYGSGYGTHLNNASEYPTQTPVYNNHQNTYNYDTIYHSNYSHGYWYHKYSHFNFIHSDHSNYKHTSYAHDNYNGLQQFYHTDYSSHLVNAPALYFNHQNAYPGITVTTQHNSYNYTVYYNTISLYTPEVHENYRKSYNELPSGYFDGTVNHQSYYYNSLYTDRSNAHNNTTHNDSNIGTHANHNNTAKLTSEPRVNDVTQYGQSDLVDAYNYNAVYVTGTMYDQDNHQNYLNIVNYIGEDLTRKKVLTWNLTSGTSLVDTAKNLVEFRQKLNDLQKTRGSGFSYVADASADNKVKRPVNNNITWNNRTDTDSQFEILRKNIRDLSINLTGNTSINLLSKPTTNISEFKAAIEALAAVPLSRPNLHHNTGTSTNIPNHSNYWNHLNYNNTFHLNSGKDEYYYYYYTLTGYEYLHTDFSLRPLVYVR
jgi:hypothetical protein